MAKRGHSLTPAAGFELRVVHDAARSDVMRSRLLGAGGPRTTDEASLPWPNRPRLQEWNLNGAAFLI